jgi:hypothetical protein
MRTAYTVKAASLVALYNNSIPFTEYEQIILSAFPSKLTPLQELKNRLFFFIVFTFLLGGCKTISIDQEADVFRPVSFLPGSLSFPHCIL